MPELERAVIEAEFTPCVALLKPDQASSPVVFCSPHSGRIYPQHFVAQSKLDALALRRSEDCYVDVLFASAPLHGAPLLSALFPRAYLDVNREPYELDPALFDEPLPDYANKQTTRVIGGLGTIARIVGDGAEIYRSPLKLACALARIDGLYRPFHAALADLIAETLTDFGRAILIDCHSMPSNSTPGRGRGRPDIVLGDRFGTACDPIVMRFLNHAFSQLGYVVNINRPYAGGFITEHYGRPSRGIDALQIEINRGLYLNETTLEPTGGFDRLRHDIDSVTAALTRELPDLLHRPAAAE